MIFVKIMCDNHTIPTQPTNTEPPLLWNKRILITLSWIFNERIYMVYTIVGLAWLCGWIGLKVISLFMHKDDKVEMNELYKEFKPDKADF